VQACSSGAYKLADEVRQSAGPYQAWIDGLRDQAGRLRVLMRVDRLIMGNPADYRNLHGRECSELKIDVGPGYRVY